MQVAEVVAEEAGAEEAGEEEEMAALKRHSYVRCEEPKASTSQASSGDGTKGGRRVREEDPNEAIVAGDKSQGEKQAAEGTSEITAAHTRFFDERPMRRTQINQPAMLLPGQGGGGGGLSEEYSCM